MQARLERAFSCLASRFIATNLWLTRKLRRAQLRYWRFMRSCIDTFDISSSMKKKNFALLAAIVTLVALLPWTKGVHIEAYGFTVQTTPK